MADTEVGLQVWGADGRLILDATHGCGRVLDMIALTGGTSGSKSYDVPAGQSLFYAYQRDKTFHLSYGGGGIVSPVITISGSAIRWTYSGLTSGSEYAAGFIVVGMM